MCHRRFKEQTGFALSILFRSPKLGTEEERSRFVKRKDLFTRTSFLPCSLWRYEICTKRPNVTRKMWRTRYPFMVWVSSYRERWRRKRKPFRRAVFGGHKAFCSSRRHITKGLSSILSAAWHGPMPLFANGYQEILIVTIYCWEHWAKIFCIKWKPRERRSLSCTNRAIVVFVFFLC